MEGESHDSSQDAEYALRVALAFLRLDEDQKNNNRLDYLTTAPVTLDDVPDRYKRRITVHGFDASIVTEDDLRRIAELSSLEVDLKPPKEGGGEEEEDLGETIIGENGEMVVVAVGASPPALLLASSSDSTAQSNKRSKVLIKPIREKLSTAATGTSNTDSSSSSTGSTVFEYPNPVSALETFRLLPTSSPLFHPHGHPDKEGFMRKSIAIAVNHSNSSTTGSSPSSSSKAEAICYHRLPLLFTKAIKVQNRFVGKLMGPKGSTVVNIQRVSGCRVASGERG